MKRSLSIIALSILLAAGQFARGQDRVRYFDRKTKPGREVTVTGTIQEENPSRIKIKPPRGEARTILVNSDLIDVEYQVPNLLSQDNRKARNREMDFYKPAANLGEKQLALKEAIELYQKLLPEAKDAKIKRQVDYKIAKLLALQAELDSSQTDLAIDKLAKFLKENPNSWQVSLAARTLATLYVNKKNWDGAEKVYQDLAKTPNVPPEIVQECNLALAQVLVRAGKNEQAAAKLAELEKTIPADSPEGVRLRITKGRCLAASNKLDQAVQVLEGIIAKTPDKDLIAAAHNALGDCYRKANLPGQAKFEYLWVDVMYNQNRQEHAKAVYHLSNLFRNLNDAKRAKLYEERLSKEFAGVDFDRS
jgi:lipopolysaccharide biosynthesis regulator YciM